MQFYAGDERLYYTEMFLNDQDLKKAYQAYVSKDEKAYSIFSASLANNFCIQFSPSKYLYEDPGFTSTALMDAMESGECAEAIYRQQKDQHLLYSKFTYTVTWNNLVYRGEVAELPEFTYSLYKIGNKFYLYTNQSWATIKYLGIYNELPLTMGYLDTIYYTGDDSYYTFSGSTWVKDNIIETAELPPSSYDYYDVNHTLYVYMDGTYNLVNYKGEVAELPESASDYYAYTVGTTTYMAINVKTRSFPDISQPMVMIPIQAAVERSTGQAAYWYLFNQEPFYIQALKSIKYGSIKHFFLENRKAFLPSYDMFLIDSDRKRKAFINTMFKEFDRFTDVVNSLATYNDADNIPDQFLIYFMEILGYTVNDQDGTLDEMQVRSLIKNLMEVYRYKGSTYAFEVFFGCMGIDCGVRELYFDRRLFYQTEENPYTRTTSSYAFAYYLTPKNPVTSSYYFSSGDTVRAINITAPITSGEWDRLLKSVDTPTEDTVLEMLGYKENSTLDMEEPFTYFKTNYLLFNFTSPYNRIKYGTAQYPIKTTDITKREFDAYRELMDRIIPIFIKQYYQNYFETEIGEEDVIHYGSSRENPLDLFFVDSNVYNDDIIRNKLQSEGKQYPYSEITNADEMIGDYRVYRQLLQGNSIKDLPDHYVYDVIGGLPRYTITLDGEAYLQMTAAEATVYLKEGSTDIYNTPGGLVVGTLSTTTADISDGTFTVPVTRYFWQVNEVGASLYNLEQGASVRIIPDLLPGDVFVAGQSSSKGETDYFSSTLEDVEWTPTFGDSPKGRLLFEHDRWKEDSHIGNVSNQEIEFEYNAYLNPLIRVEAKVNTPLTVTLE